MQSREREPVFALPEEAFVVDAVDVLDCWLNRTLPVAPDWLKRAARGLELVERQALGSTNVPIGWAYDSARLRLRLAALAEDNLAPNGALHDALADLDRRLRAAAKSDVCDDVRVQIGKIRVALRPYLTAKLDRRDRAAYMGSRRVVR